LAMGALVAWFGLGGSFLAAGIAVGVVMVGIIAFGRAKKIL
jgi:hypothetical protein